MADIVNKKREDGKPLFTPKGNVEALYRYNPIITNIIETVKVPFNTFITSGVKYWRTQLATYGFLGTSYGLYEADLANSLYNIPFDKDDLKLELDYHADEPNGTIPPGVSFSIIEIVDPSGTAWDVEDRYVSKLMERLESYINMGLYPLIARPMTDGDIYYLYERYEDIKDHRDYTGTIVDINKVDSHVKGKSHIVATVMWDPNLFIPDNEDPINPLDYIAKGGYLSLIDMIPTPECWVDIDNYITNVGVLIYEYTAARDLINRVMNVDGIENFLNDALLSGQIELSAFSNLIQSARELMQQTWDGMKTSMENRMTSPPTPIIAEEDVESSPNVPVEDASSDDIFGHRLRLYDDDLTDIDSYPSDYYFD